MARTNYLAEALAAAAAALGMMGTAAQAEASVATTQPAATPTPTRTPTPTPAPTSQPAATTQAAEAPAAQPPLNKMALSLPVAVAVNGTTYPAGSVLVVSKENGKLSGVIVDGQALRTEMKSDTRSGITRASKPKELKASMRPGRGFQNLTAKDINSILRSADINSILKSADTPYLNADAFQAAIKQNGFLVTTQANGTVRMMVISGAYEDLNVEDPTKNRQAFGYTTTISITANAAGFSIEGTVPASGDKANTVRLNNKEAINEAVNSLKQSFQLLRPIIAPPAAKTSNSRNDALVAQVLGSQARTA